MSIIDTDTICAIATTPGSGGVGIVRVSGPDASSIAGKILHFSPTARHAHYCDFLDPDGNTLDKGIALFFTSPNSFTGEDILELQGHGGTFSLNSLLQTCCLYGARLARPGEFSERAFLNNKIDLLQAEAIADLIEASSEQAARSALRTFKGEFSRLIENLVSRITRIRVEVEAAIDFSDEDIDFIADGKVVESTDKLIATMDSIISKAHQGALIKDGINVVIAGKPNAGKSSLLNALSGQDTAIVTNIPGTTRDLLNEKINIDGLPLHITDTAGLRHSTDLVEQEGVRRALKAIDQSDHILLIIDHSETQQTVSMLLEHLELLGINFADINEENIKLLKKLTLVFNKADLVPQECRDQFQSTITTAGQSLACLVVSAHTGDGLGLLKDHLKNSVGFNVTEEAPFIARQRHLQALSQTRKLIENASEQLKNKQSIELVAEDLRLAQKTLGEITGEFTSDDLLGKIFSSFCVGK